MQKSFRFSKALSSEHLKFYQQFGYIHFKQFIPKDSILLFISEIDRINNQLIADNVSKINGVPLKFGTGVHGKRIVHRLAFASHYSDTLRNFLKDERLLALFALLDSHEGRIGEHEKDGLVVNHYENTATSNFKSLGWHTDSPRDLFLGSRIMPMLNVGLHLDDCPKENGGLRVLPGTHKQSLFSLFFKKKYFVDNRSDPNELGFDIEAGDLTVHNGNLWHRVEQSRHLGERSRRRVMYIPIITGKVKVKHAESRTPIYHRLAQLPSFQFKLQS